jgi:CHASE3 domain sensor protein
MRLRRRIQLLFVALFLVLVAGVTTDTIADMRRADAAQTIDDELVPARDDLHALLTSLVEQETGQRGFLLTGRDSFLEPYERGRRQTEATLDGLASRFQDEPDIADHLDRIRSRISAWQQLGADFEIDAKRADRSSVVTALVESGTATRLFGQARMEIEDLAADLDRRQERKERQVEQLDDTLVLLRLGNLVVAIALLALVRRLVIRWVTQPIERLAAAVRGAASGRLHDPIPASGPPDLASLGNDIDAMRRRLLSELDDAARARTALADRGMIVVTLREDLAPSPVALPDGLSLAGRFLPAKGLVPGDWYDVVRIDDDQIAFALVDVSGHGAEVATFALRTKALTMAAVTAHEPGDALAWVAAQIGETGELFFTGVVVRVSASTGAIRYASAGHPPLLLAGLTGVLELAPTGPLLGPWTGSWATEKAQLDRGGVLMAYSDGLVEARDSTGELFGVPRLTKLVSDQQMAGVDAVADAALDAVQSYAADPGRDDVTICVVSR